MEIEIPVQWFDNRKNHPITIIKSINEVIPAGQMNQIRAFHRQIPAFLMSPLKTATDENHGREIAWSASQYLR